MISSEKLDSPQKTAHLRSACQENKEIKYSFEGVNVILKQPSAIIKELLQSFLL